MKVKMRLEYMFLGGTIFTNFFVLGDDTKWIQCSENSGDVWYKLKSTKIKKYNKETVLPNYYECSYMEGYEEFMFQESLVWDYDFNFHLYCSIQKYFIDNLKTVNTQVKEIELEY